MRQDSNGAIGAGHAFVRILAFLQRAFSGSVSGTRSPYRFEPFEDQAARSEYWIKKLEIPDQSLKFRIVLENLRWQWDLLVEEAALLPQPRLLQIRIIELATTHYQARGMTNGMVAATPISKLFQSLVLQAIKTNSHSIRITFSEDLTIPQLVNLELPSGDIENLSFPSELGVALRGFSALIEGAGYARIRPYLQLGGPTAENIEFRWSDHTNLELMIA